MPKRLVIEGRLPGLNDYIAAERASRYKGAEMKRKEGRKVARAIRAQIEGTLRGPVYLDYLWVEKDRRRDKDNIVSFGYKVIHDALVKTGRLKNDGWSDIKNFGNEFVVDKEHPRIEVTIYEAGEKHNA